MNQCGCELGGNCTKTTVCALESATQDLQDRANLLEEFVKIVREECSMTLSVAIRDALKEL